MLTGVPKTALGVARIRARESERPNRLFNDPYAAAFVAAVPDAYAEDANRSDVARAVGARLAMHVIVRTRFYDDYLLAAADEGIRQVVVLAGIDAAASARRLVVPADLTKDWPAELIAAGFEQAMPTAWLIEGLLVYLTHDDAATLLTAVGDLSAPGSRLSCEQSRSAMLLAEQSNGANEATALWQGGVEDVGGWLSEHAWAVESFDLGAVAAGYGRPTSTETATGFLIARRP